MNPTTARTTLNRPKYEAIGAVAPAAAVAAVLGSPLALVVLGATWWPSAQRARTRSGVAEFPALAQRTALAVVLLGLIAANFSAVVIASAAGLAATAIARVAFDAAIARTVRRTGAGEPTLLVGTAAAVRSAAATLASYPELGIVPVATATDEDAPTVLPGGSIDEINELVATHAITHVLAVGGLGGDAVEAAFSTPRPDGVRVSVLPAGAEALTVGAEIVDVRGLPMLTLAPRPQAAGIEWNAKRVLDYTVSALGLIALLPLFAVVATLIKLDTPGPVFFRQQRAGRDGRFFSIWKFRTMTDGADAAKVQLNGKNEASGPFFKIENDPRVTRVGKVLRALSIDELPQLINVIAGNMSLVGPRPFLASELAEAPELFEWRMKVLPGITGLWQIAGRSWLPAAEGTRMDRTYVEQWSLGLDLRIIFRTVAVALKGDRRPSVNVQEVPSIDANRYTPLVEDAELTAAGADVDASLVIVTHESAGDIRACLDALRNIDDVASFEAIVVDNASTDGTADIIANEYPEVRLIRKVVRDGFSVNSNIGLSVASAERVMLLNPDTQMQSGALDRLVADLDANPEAGAVAPRLIYPDGSLQHSARRFPKPVATIIRRTPLRMLMQSSDAEREHLMADVELTTPTNVDWVLGAAMMMRKTTINALGGLDEQFRLYCEDIDLCWRIHEAGLAVRYLPTAEVMHDLGEATRKSFFTIKTVWHFRSMFRFIVKNGIGSPVAKTPAVVGLRGGYHVPAPAVRTALSLAA